MQGSDKAVPFALEAAAVAAGLALLLWQPVPLPAAEHDPPSKLRAAAAAVCASSGDLDTRVARALGGAVLVDTAPLEMGGPALGSRSRYLLKDGSHVYLERFAPGGDLRRLTLVYHAADAKGRRPEWMVIADPSCGVLTGRRLRYDAEGTAVAIERTDASLETVEAREPLNPPVPEGEATDGVRVALVDSGVNYLLADIRDRLARDRPESVLGYDYWDMDARPFDAHPARSPFFPRRHGTRTAGVLIAESPVARLVPYRYPRPDMTRMADLIEHAAANGVRIVNLSLGGADAGEWESFASAARRHPEMLFVVSAGNEGRNIDREKVYPAAFGLENVLTATSADASGLPAEGSNWGPESVDLLVPAEELVSVDFYGRPRLVSGSSYAAARVSALAACLLGANPEWWAPELKAAILARVQPSVNDVMRFVAHGFLDDPMKSERGACAAEPAAAEVASESRRDRADLYPGGVFPEDVTLALSAALVVLEGTGWSLPEVESAAREAARIFAQCGIGFGEIRLFRARAPRRLLYFDNRHAMLLVRQLEVPRPAVFFVRDTVQEIPFDAEAIGQANSNGRRDLAGTVWMTEAVGHSGVALAHELYHVVADSGSHSDDRDNLMFPETLGTNTALNEAQCQRMRKVGTAFGHLRPVD